MLSFGEVFPKVLKAGVGVATATAVVVGAAVGVAVGSLGDELCMIGGCNLRALPTLTPD